MADFSYLGNKWDVNFGCFYLKKIVDSKLFFEQTTSQAAIDNLKTLSKHFEEQAVSNPNENFELNPQDEEVLETQWLTILVYVTKIHSDSFTQSAQNVANLKLCLVNIGIYIMFKCRRRIRDLEFGIDIMSLTLAALRACLEVEYLDDAESLLKIASQHICPRINDESVYDFDAVSLEKLGAKFELCRSSLFVYRVLFFYKVKKFDDILTLLTSTKHDPIQFTVDQSESLSRICLNVSHGLLTRQDYESAIIWLKFSHSFAKQTTEGSALNDSCTEESLTLLAACYMHMDASKYCPQIIEILDYAEQTAVNLEITLQALLNDGKELTSIVYTFSQYLQMKFQEDDGHLSVKHAAYRFFSFLEEQKKNEVLTVILNKIPWKNDQDVEESNCGWPCAHQLKWVCARFSARQLLNDNRTAELFQLLCQVQNWTKEEADAVSIYELMSMAESVALRFINEEDKLQVGLDWYEIIVQFANQYGIDSRVIWNVMSCLLQLPHETGFDKAQKLSLMIPEFDSWCEIHPLCVRLQMALRLQDYDKALQIATELEVGSEFNDWNQVQKAMCRSAFIAREHQLHEPMLNYLERALEASKVPFMRAILLRLSLRFRLEILSKTHDPELKEQVLNNIISTISSAYATTREEEDPFFVDIRIWFGRTAWNLARFANKQTKQLSAYFRHHLFKWSSQFLVMDSCNQEEAEIAMIKAIEAVFEFGPGSKRIAYVRVLNSALDVVQQFKSKGSKGNRLIDTMEFHALCELKNWSKVEQLFRSYSNDKDVKTEHGADFFLSLASILIATKDAESREEVTNELTGIVETFVRKRVSPEQRTILAGLAASSLRIAIDLSTSTTAVLSPKIVLYCRWLVGVAFDSFQEPLTLRTHLQLLDDLVPLMCSDSVPLAEIRWMFTKIWNSILMTCDQNLKRDAARWLKDRFRRSPHYPKLMKWFQPQFDHVSSGRL